MSKALARAGLILCLLMVASSAFADTSIINVYDANGNLVTGDGRYYEYNDANQLVRVRQGSDQTGPVIAEYFYDFSGQRVKKIENGVTTYYVGKHFEKQVGGTGEGNTSYYLGDDGERVAKKDPALKLTYYHLDHLDGVNVMTDETGTVVARSDYLPFGELRNGSTGSEKYAYTGKERDKTDLYYFDARYNSPQFRHFTQADPAEPEFSDPQDLNRYAYVGNNPLSFVDDDGFKKTTKKHFSKREKRAIALGLDPDKYKYKVGKMSKREFKWALEQHTSAIKRATVRASAAPSGAPVASDTKLSAAVPRKSVNIYASSSIMQSQIYRQESEELNEIVDRGVDATDAAVSFVPVFGDIKDGAVWTYKFHKFNFENAVGHLTGGKYGKVHNGPDMLHLYEEMPFGPGFVIKGTEYFGAKLLGKESSISEDDLLESIPLGFGDLYKISKPFVVPLVE